MSEKKNFRQEKNKKFGCQDKMLNKICMEIVRLSFQIQVDMDVIATGLVN